jgi:hypothetical protein
MELKDNCIFSCAVNVIWIFVFYFNRTDLTCQSPSIASNQDLGIVNLRIIDYLMNIRAIRMVL